MIVVYRPVGVEFLDKHSPLAFWRTEAAALNDFPDAKIKGYTADEVEAYCKGLNLSTDGIVIYEGE